MRETIWINETLSCLNLLSALAEAKCDSNWKPLRLVFPTNELSQDEETRWQAHEKLIEVPL